MLRLGDKQVEGFKPLMLESFEDEMVAHLGGFVPKHCQVLGEEGVREVIRLGMERAEAHHFTRRGPVQLYLELMFMFGGRFDTDPLLPWATEALAEDQDGGRRGGEISRAMRLYRAMMGYIDELVGQDRRPAIMALRRTRDAIAQLEAIEPPGPWLEALLAEIYPERCSYLGEEQLQALMARGPGMAAKSGLGTDRGALLCIVLAFAAGHDFADDRLFPWIRATLDNAALTTPEQRVASLEKRATIYLDHVLKYLAPRCVDV